MVSIVLHAFFKNKCMTQSQNKIIEGSRELFYRYGIRRVTMDDIARHLGVSKKTLYTSFTDKNHLITALAEIDFKKHDQEMVQIRKSSANAIDEIVQNMRYMSGIFNGMNTNLIFDMQRYHHTAWKLYMDFKSRCVATTILTNINRGIKEGLYRSDFNIKVLSQLRIAELDIAFNPELYPSDKFNIVEVQIELLKHFIMGIATLKGHRLMTRLLKTDAK